MADAIFQVQADYFVNRERGILQCCWHLSRLIVQNVNRRLVESLLARIRLIIHTRINLRNEVLQN